MRSLLRLVVLGVLAALLLTVLLPNPIARPPGEEGVLRPLRFLLWPAALDHRIEPSRFTRQIRGRRILEATALPGEKLVCQLALRSNGEHEEVTPEASELGDLVSGRYVWGKDFVFRFGRYLPVDETGCMTADPLKTGSAVGVPPHVTVPVWVEVDLPPDLPPGSYAGGIEARGRDETHYVHLDIEVIGMPLSEASKSLGLRATLAPGPMAPEGLPVPSAEAILKSTISLLAAAGIRTLVIEDPSRAERVTELAAGLAVNVHGKGDPALKGALDADPRSLLLESTFEDARREPWRLLESDATELDIGALDGWPADVYLQPGGDRPSGQGFLLYPGAGVPLSSMRLEMLRKGLEDARLAMTLLGIAGERGETEVVAEVEALVGEVVTGRASAFEARRRLDDIARRM